MLLLYYYTYIAWGPGNQAPVKSYIFTSGRRVYIPRPPPRTLKNHQCSACAQHRGIRGSGMCPGQCSVLATVLYSYSESFIDHSTILDMKTCKYWNSVLYHSVCVPRLEDSSGSGSGSRGFGGWRWGRRCRRQPWPCPALRVAAQSSRSVSTPRWPG